ncbi:hypothetical protein Hanom_Chr11g01018401 [Helianthus anomalus]
MTLVTRASSSFVQDAIAGSWDVGVGKTGWGSGFVGCLGWTTQWGLGLFIGDVGVGVTGWGDRLAKPNDLNFKFKLFICPAMTWRGQRMKASQLGCQDRPTPGLKPKPQGPRPNPRPNPRPIPHGLSSRYEVANQQIARYG